MPPGYVCVQWEDGERGAATFPLFHLEPPRVPLTWGWSPRRVGVSGWVAGNPWSTDGPQSWQAQEGRKVLIKQLFPGSEEMDRDKGGGLRIRFVAAEKQQ